ncbi:MAG: MBL fold metallo-hydrolase [Ignavibacteriales bacterium]|nr:MAG: MBL fold metallo-hydrolase [Ignavibacteriales bacterium]
MKNYNYFILYLCLFLLTAAMPPVVNESDADSGTLTLAADSLHNIGHASMKIKTADGKVIYIDPFQPGNYSDSADIVLVTHGHSDHNQQNLVKKKTTATTITHVQSNIGGVYQVFNIDGIKIYSVPAYNANHNINSCVGYVIEFNGIRLYHAGDTGNIPEMANLADSNITYALFPIDSIYTMSPAAATLAAEMVQADYSIPMHTKPPPDNYDEDKVSRFVPANRLLVRNGETIALYSPSTGTDDLNELPSDFKLFQSYPNPFNPSTTISYSIPSASYVSLKVYDVNGREVETLFEGNSPAGNYVKEWTAKNFSSGVYFYRLQSGGFSDTKKFVLVK